MRSGSLPIPDGSHSSRCYNHMGQHRHLAFAGRLRSANRERDIGGAWCRITTGMVMDQDEAACADRATATDDRTDVGADPEHGTPRDRLDREQPAFVVDVESEQPFARLAGKRNDVPRELGHPAQPPRTVRDDWRIEQCGPLLAARDATLRSAG